LAIRARNRRNNQLRNAHSMSHSKRHSTEIDERHLNFTAIIRINCSRRIWNSNSMIGRKPTARTNLPFPTNGQRHGETACDTDNISRLNNNIFFKARAKIHARGVRALILGQCRGGVNAFQL
jgi:hypothetical protein